MSKINNIHNNFILAANAENIGTNKHTYNNKISQELSGNSEQTNLDSFIAEKPKLQELDLAGTPQKLLESGILSEKYLLENGFSPVTKDSAVFQLGNNEDKGKYSLDVQIFYNSTTKQYTYGVKVFKEGKQIDTKDNAELEAFLIANYGFGFEELLSGEHIDFDKKSKSYILDLRPVVSPEEVLSLEKEGGFELIENEKPERTNRRFAIALIHSKFDSLINEYSQMLTVLGGLDFGLWYEGAKIGIQEISEFLGIENFHYSGVSRIKELVKKRDEICKKLDNAIDQPDLFNALFKDFLGTDYSDGKMQGLRDIRHKGVNGNESDSVKQAECYREFEKQFPDNDVDKLLEKWDSELTQKINTLGDIVIMLLLTKGIGAGAQKAGAEVLKAIGEKNVKLAMSKFVVFSNAIAQTVTTMSAFEGSKTLVRGLTNGEDLSTDEIIDRTVTSLGEGAIMGVEIALMEMFLISPMTKALSKRLVKFTDASEKIAASTAEAGSKGLAMEEVMKIYEAETKGMREAVHTALAVPTLSLGFTGIETAKAKFDEFNAEQYRELLIQNKENTQEDINAYLAMSEDELRTEYTINTAKEQLESMTTIEGIGILFKRVQAAVIADKALSPQYNNILKARLCPVEENGVTKYELKTPDDKPLQFVVKEKSGNKTVTKFSKPEDAVASYMTLCTDIAKTIVKDTKNTKIANPLNLSSRIKKAKTVEEVIVIQNEINDANLSEEVKNRLKVECYKKYAKLTEENADYEYKKIDGEEKFEEGDDFSQIEKSYAEMAERYEQELETLEEAAKKAANQNVQKLVELGAPDVIIYHEQRRAVEGIQEYKKIKTEIEAIGDENLRNELLNDLDDMNKSDYKFSMRGRMRSFREILNRKTKTPSARLMQFLKEKKPEVYEQLLKNPESIDDPHLREVKEEFAKIDKYEFLMDKITLTNDKKEADKLYEQYLQDEFVSDNPKIDAEVKERCRQINRDFGVKVFLPVNLKEAGVALKLVYQELANYREFARQDGETANMPRCINFMRARKRYLNSDTIGRYSSKYNTMSVDGLEINRNNEVNRANNTESKKNSMDKDVFSSLKNIIRHEMAHANIHPEDDAEFPEWFNPMVELDELFDGGASEGIIMLALKNVHEFLAYTAECDMKKFSADFKEKLVKLGMPRWMTKMQNPEASKDIMPRGERVLAEMSIIEEFERLREQRESDVDNESDEDVFAKRLNPDEMQLRRNDIKAILKEAEENKRKISAKEITERLHIKPQDLYNAMRGDDELLALFDKVKDSTRGRKPGVVKKEQTDNKTESTQRKEPKMYPEWKPDSEYYYNENPQYTKEILELKEEAAHQNNEELYSSIQPAIQELVSNLQNGQISDLSAFKLGNNKLGIVAQKDEFGITTVTVKNWQGAKENWDAKAPTEDSMQIVYNPDGSILRAKVSITEFFEENDVVNYEYSYFTNPEGQIEVQSTRNYYFDISRYENTPNEPTSQKTAIYIPKTDSMDGWKCSETSGIFLNQPIDYDAAKPGLMNSFLNLIKTDKTSKPDLSQKAIRHEERTQPDESSKPLPSINSDAITNVLAKIKENIAKNLIAHVDRDVYTEAFNIIKSNPESLNDFIKSQIESMARNSEKLLPETKEFLQGLLKEIITERIGDAQSLTDLNTKLSGVRKLQDKDRKFFTKNLFLEENTLKVFVEEGFNKGQIAAVLNTPYQTISPILEKFNLKVDGRKKAVEQTAKTDAAKEDEGAEFQRKKREAQSRIPEAIARRKDIQKSILKLRCNNIGAAITEIWLSLSESKQIGSSLQITPLDIGKYLKALGVLKPVNKVLNESLIIKLYEKRSPRTGKREYNPTEIAKKLGYTKQQVELVLRRANLVPAKRDYSRQVAKIRQMILQDFSVPISTIAKAINESDAFVRARIAEEGIEHKEYLIQKAREKLNTDKDIYYLYTDKEASVDEICELFDCTKEDVFAAIKRHELVRNKLNAQSGANTNTTGKSSESNDNKTSAVSGTASGNDRSGQTGLGRKPESSSDSSRSKLQNKPIKDLQEEVFNLQEQIKFAPESVLDDICDCIAVQFDLIECSEKERSLVIDFIIELEKIKEGITTEKEVLNLPFMDELMILREKLEQISDLCENITEIRQEFSNARDLQIPKLLDEECLCKINTDDKFAKLSKVVDAYKSSENLECAKKAINKALFELKNPGIREEAENYAKEISLNGVARSEDIEAYIDSLISIKNADKSTALGDFATIIRDAHLTNKEAVTNYLTIKQIFDKSISQYNETINEYNARAEKYNKETKEYNAEQVRKYGKKAELKEYKKYKKTTTVPRPEIMFPEMYEKYSKQGDFGSDVLKNLIENYYLKEESIAITKCKGHKNQSKRAVSIITIEAKESILKHWKGKKSEIIDKFERALRVFASSDEGEYGIKDNLRQNNPKAEYDMEVKITGTGLGKYRLFSKNGDYVFDVFHGHQ